MKSKKQENNACIHEGNSHLKLNKNIIYWMQMKLKLISGFSGI